MRVTVLGTVALLLLSTAPAATQESEELRWTPEKSMEFKAVSQTAISPDGERVAYVVRVPVMEGEKSEYLSHVWLTGADGTGNVQFTRGEHSATSPAFSPDGEWLAFTSRRGNGSDPDGPQNQVWVISVHGGEAFAATDAEAGVGAFRWSPDGSRIAYLMRD
ncbi:MAG: hypothetical protein HKO53_08425, partial [Gemmatimonadetes bacterium]|nr:hypothetical protein [Gemmatimonadota bacterium]